MKYYSVPIWDNNTLIPLTFEVISSYTNHQHMKHETVLADKIDNKLWQPEVYTIMLIFYDYIWGAVSKETDIYVLENKILRVTC